MEVVVISKPAGLVWLLGEAHGSVKVRGFVTCGGGRTVSYSRRLAESGKAAVATGRFFRIIIHMHFLMLLSQGRICVT